MTKQQFIAHISTNDLHRWFLNLDLEGHNHELQLERQQK